VVCRWATGVRVPVGTGDFSFHRRVQTGSGGPTQPPIQWIPGALSLGVKRPRREADHSPPSSVEVNNAWSRWLQTIHSHLTCFRFVLILSSHLRRDLPCGLLLWGITNKSTNTASHEITAFYVTRSPLPCSQEPAIGLCSNPDESSLHTIKIFL
jgi:hypothetical protein